MTLPWTTIILVGAGLALLLILIRWGWRAAKNQGSEEVRRTIAETEAERRAKDAEIAAQPMSRSPLSDLFVRDK